MPFINEKYKITIPSELMIIGDKVLYYGEVFTVEEVCNDGTIWIVDSKKAFQLHLHKNQVKKVEKES